MGFASLGPTSEASRRYLNSVRGEGRRSFFLRKGWMCLRFGVACAQELCAGSKGAKARLLLRVCWFPCVTAGGFRISVSVSCSVVNAVS